MRIDHDGNVGIGTSSPSFVLDVTEQLQTLLSLKEAVQEQQKF